MAFIKWVFLMIIWGSFMACGVVLWFGSELPELDDLVKLSRQSSIILYDTEGQTLATYGDFYGQPIRAEELPKHVINALLAIEDRRFYSHFGVDPVGVVRAFLRNTREGRTVQGGSTITQQLAKNFLQSKKIFSCYDRSYKRKIMEVLLALKIERRFTKNQILTMHLNRVYMGSGAWGVDAAALRYFGRHARELGLYEAAVLMGLLRAPSYYSPANHYERSETRAKRVLDAMVTAGFISQDVALAAMAMPSPLETKGKKNSARYFTDWVVDQLYELVNTQAEDLEVVTTLSLPIQRIAERQAQHVMAVYGNRWKAKQTALVSMRPDGAVRAMVGGIDYGKSCFNRAAKALRQPGSAFKYFVFFTSLEEGYTPHSVMNDTPITLGGWRPKNFKYHARGETTLLDGFAHSVNAVAIRLLIDVGLPKVIAMAKRLGITSPLPKNYTLALGTCGVTLLEMTGAFAVVANEGYKVLPYGIQSVRNKQGKILYQHQSRHRDEPEIDTETLTEMKSLLKAVTSYGTGRRAQISSVPVMGKTGTSNKGKDDRDVWFIGMTPSLVTGVWSGCDDESPMEHQVGGSPSIHLWRAFNTSVIAYLKNPKLPEWQLDEIPLSVMHPVEPSKTSTKKEADEEEGEEDDEEEGEEDDEGQDEDDPKESEKDRKQPSENSPNYDDPVIRRQLLEDIIHNMRK